MASRAISSAPDPHSVLTPTARLDVSLIKAALARRSRLRASSAHTAESSISVPFEPAGISLSPRFTAVEMGIYRPFSPEEAGGFSSGIADLVHSLLADAAAEAEATSSGFAFDGSDSGNASAVATARFASQTAEGGSCESWCGCIAGQLLFEMTGGSLPYSPSPYTTKDHGKTVFKYDASWCDMTTPLYYKKQGQQWYWSPSEPETTNWAQTSTTDVKEGAWSWLQWAGVADVADTNKEIIRILEEFNPSVSDPLPVKDPKKLVMREVKLLCYEQLGISNTCSCQKSNCAKEVVKKYSKYMSDIDKYARTSKKECLNKALDIASLLLDIGGIAPPPVGPICDLANAGLAALRGKWVDALLSFLSAIPFAGDSINAAKIGMRAGGAAALKFTKLVKVMDKVVGMIKNPPVSTLFDKIVAAARQIQTKGVDFVKNKLKSLFLPLKAVGKTAWNLRQAAKKATGLLKTFSKAKITQWADWISGQVSKIAVCGKMSTTQAALLEGLVKVFGATSFFGETTKRSFEIVDVVMDCLKFCVNDAATNAEEGFENLYMCIVSVTNEVHNVLFPDDPWNDGKTWALIKEADKKTPTSVTLNEPPTCFSPTTAEDDAVVKEGWCFVKEGTPPPRCSKPTAKELREYEPEKEAREPPTGHSGPSACDTSKTDPDCVVITEPVSSKCQDASSLSDCFGSDFSKRRAEIAKCLELPNDKTASSNNNILNNWKSVPRPIKCKSCKDTSGDEPPCPYVEGKLTVSESTETSVSAVQTSVASALGVASSKVGVTITEGKKDPKAAASSFLEEASEDGSLGLAGGGDDDLEGTVSFTVAVSVYDADDKVDGIKSTFEGAGSAFASKLKAKKAVPSDVKAHHPPEEEEEEEDEDEEDAEEEEDEEPAKDEEPKDEEPAKDDDAKDDDPKDDVPKDDDPKDDDPKDDDPKDDDPKDPKDDDSKDDDPKDDDPKDDDPKDDDPKDDDPKDEAPKEVLNDPADPQAAVNGMPPMTTPQSSTPGEDAKPDEAWWSAHNPPPWWLAVAPGTSPPPREWAANPYTTSMARR